ncbi:MAG: NAD(P)H-binding protein [Pseudomonadota bacterium]
MLGASGTIGQATAAALAARGHTVVCPLRPKAARPRLPETAVMREAEVTDPRSLRDRAIRGERFDALVSCLASRSGLPGDAWAVDHRATVDALEVAAEAGARRVVLLSAICVQRPMLAFQRAKLAAEAAVIASGLDYAIVRPTAFFKSLSGQVARVQSGKGFLAFGDGRLTACKPISDRDLGAYLAQCLEDPGNRILPIGGPGRAITPLDQAAMLSRLLGREVPVRRVPVALLDGIITMLSLGGRLVPRLRAKAELARIGRYYATQSMLCLNPQTGLYDAEETPETGSDTLEGHYRRLIAGEAETDLGAHAVF